MHNGFSFLHGKRVLLTGGTGFVGRHLLPLLVESGATVTCLVRASSDVTRLPDSVAVARADLETGQGLYPALADKDIVIHMAALLFGLRQQDYLYVNATAARNLANALVQLHDAGGFGKQCRIVLVSSMAATGPCSVVPGVTDSAVPMPVSAYGWSKLLVEEIVGRAIGEDLVTIRPPIIYGSGDRGLLPMFRGVRYGFAFCPGWKRDFPVSAIHADDMARAVLCACHPDAHGIYHVSDGQAYAMDAFYRAMGRGIDRALGRKERRLHIFHMPLPALAFTAAISSASALAADVLFRMSTHRRHRAPQWNLDKYREARQSGWLCDGSRICRELGFIPQVGLEEGMLEAAQGYRREGLL